MGSTLGSFWVGVTGIQSSQYAINTTAHNITNAGTEGYSRQQVLLTDLSYLKVGRTAIGSNVTGIGTKIQDVRVVRDSFIDRAYRSELGTEEYYATKYEVVSEVQNYFGEMESSSFRDTLQSLWSAAEELQKESNSIVTRSSYIASAVNFVEQANQIYSELKTYQGNLNTQIVDQIDRINEIASSIFDLNKTIVRVEASGIESANDYRDQREALLDELGGLVSMSYYENADGQVDVYIERRTLVSMDRTYELSTRNASDECDYLIPVWKDDQEDLFDFHYSEEQDTRLDPDAHLVNVPGPTTGTDIGSLKALIMSRGDWVSNYTEIPTAPEAPVVPVRSAYASDAEYQAAVTQYQDDYKDYQKDYETYTHEVEYYNTYVEPYTVNNIIAQFDRLVHGIVTQINDILCPNKEITIMDGGTPKTITVLDEENAGYGMGEGNQLQGVELFNRRTEGRYTEQTVTLEDGTSATVQVYNEENSDNYLSLYTLGNISVNDELIKNPSLLGLSNLQGEELQDTANKLISMWSDDFSTLNPNSLVVNDYMGYYKEFIADFANKGYTYNGIAESEHLTVQELENQRQSVVGVSTDEELTNMIKFQQAFNASSRYFTVVSEMVEHLIMKLGA